MTIELIDVPLCLDFEPDGPDHDCPQDVVIHRGIDDCRHHGHGDDYVGKHERRET